LEADLAGMATTILLAGFAGVDVGVGGLAACATGAVCFGWPGMGGSGTGVTLCSMDGTGTGVGVFDDDLIPGAGMGTGVSPGVMMRVSSPAFAGLGRLQCTQQQSL
jgi:hypothetical protein